MRHRAARRLPKQTMSGEEEQDTIAHLVDEPLAQHMEAVLPAREADFPSLQQMRSQRALSGPANTHPDHSPRPKENSLLSLDIRSQKTNRHQMLAHRPRRHIEAQGRTSRPSKAKMKRLDGITFRQVRAPMRQALLRPAKIGSRNLAEARRPAILTRPKFQTLASKHPQVITLPCQRARMLALQQALQQTRPFGRTEMP
jgi:hypothetical protein